MAMKFHLGIIKLENVAKTSDELQEAIRKHVLGTFRRRGAIIGISGGIDSAVTMALAAKALGPDKVIGIMLPERDSSKESARLATLLAEKFEVPTLYEDITEALEGFGCYRRRDEAVLRVFPHYNPKTYKMKIGIKHSALSSGLPPIFYLTIVNQEGVEESKKLPSAECFQIIAASNFKQRSRMSMLYYHAERLHFSVIGTPNKHEYLQGFFVKHGDSGADLMPLSGLYKSQVYELAYHLGIPQEIIDRTPTTDTYSAEQTQEEFFYQFPFYELDHLWYAFENKVPVNEVAAEMNMTEDMIRKTFDSFFRKHQTTEYLRMAPIHL
jgi:NAD+ synthase